MATLALFTGGFDVAPSFKGSDYDFGEFLLSSVRYPELELENKVQGRVMIRMILNEAGKVVQAKVAKAESLNFDKEAIRLCENLPAFTGGIHEGKPVKVYYSLPVSFRITEYAYEKGIKIIQKTGKDEDFKLGYAAMVAERYKEAIIHFTASINKYPKEYLIYESKGECEILLGNIEQACSEFKEAKKRKSPTASAWLNTYCKN